MSDYWTDFARESDEHITDLNNALLRLERDPTNDSAMDEIFRVAHTLKGNCGAMGLTRASDLAHAIEDLLDAIRRGDLEVSASVMDTIFQAVDELEAMLEEAHERADGTITRDPSSVIDTLRTHTEGIDEGTAPLDPPSAEELEQVLTRFEPPTNSDHDAFFVRLAIVDDAHSNNGQLVVEALNDAFDLIGTQPSREAIANDEYGSRFDAIFGSAVGEAAIGAALEPVEAVEAFEILDVTDQLEAQTATPAPPDAHEADSSTGAPASTQGQEADISPDDAQDLSVDELLDEFTEFDDLDELVEDVDDDELAVFDEMGDAGSFDDLLDDEMEDTVADTSDDPEADHEPAGDAETAADENVDDASAVFAELKDEVEMVGFDELQDELEELEFDEFDSDDEVDMDELLGDAADVDDTTFLEVGDEEAVEDSVLEETDPVEDEADAPAEPADESSTATPDTSEPVEPAPGSDTEPPSPVSGDEAEAQPADTGADSRDEATAMEASDAEPSSSVEPASADASTDALEEEGASTGEDGPDQQRDADADQDTGGPDIAEPDSLEPPEPDDAEPVAEDPLSAIEGLGDEDSPDDFDSDFGLSDDSLEAAAFDDGFEGDQLEFDEDDTDLAFDADEAPVAFETDEDDFDDADGFASDDQSLEESTGSLSVADEDDELFDAGVAIEDEGEDAFDSIEFDTDSVDIDTSSDADTFTTADAESGFETRSDETSTDSDTDTERVYEDVPPLPVPESIVSLRPEGDQSETDTESIQSVRVDVDQVDKLLNLVEGLVTSRVRLRHSVEADDDPQAIKQELDTLEDITSELEATVMDVRLVPLETVTNRLPRIVRDISRDQDKEVVFDIEGESVELDRSVLDQIGDPLIHLVRNAVDHGIEPPSVREDAGKPRQGTVRFEADRSRDRVTLTITDDGRGLSATGLREAALEADIMDQEALDELDDDDVYELIFHPGLSTAEEVTDVSGRGVGMDVVKRTIESLDGTVSVTSDPGNGTTVTMELPVTVAIAEVLFLEAGGEAFGVPLKVVQDIEGARAIETTDTARVLPSSDGEGPVVDLATQLQTGTQTAADEGMVVRLRDDVRPVALHCDAVYGQQEVVVKPFEGFMTGIPGLSGATVRGRGEVVNILDVNSL